VSRLQAGALAVFPRPADLGEIVADSLDTLGPQARTVLADIPSALSQVMADPAIMERVIANLVGNALRYSPAASPPLVTARDLGDRVELCVVDHGTGIPEADRKRLFLPFQRLGDPSDRSGVGLGLVVSRGLAEAMGGTVEPEETPGGGLTMVVSLPAAPAQPGRPGWRSPPDTSRVSGPAQLAGRMNRSSDGPGVTARRYSAGQCHESRRRLSAGGLAGWNGYMRSWIDHAGEVSGSRPVVGSAAR